MKPPAFFCIGFQKGGTTTLYEILHQHKDIALCRDVKEPMYYRVSGLRMLGGKTFYLNRYYGHLSPDDTRIVGEVNAGLSFTGCARNVCRDFAPDCKLIFMLRNPVDRCYSAYKYFLARGFLPCSVVRDDLKNGHAAAFDRYVHAVLDNPRKEQQIIHKRLKYLVFSQSRYEPCISEYLLHVPGDHICLLFFEEFIRDQKKACQSVFRLLDIEDDPAIDYAIRANEGNERPVSPFRSKYVMIVKGIRYILYEFLALSYKAPAICRWYQKHYESVRNRCITEDHDKSPMLPETRKYLEVYYKNDVKYIENLTGHDLKSLWY